MDFSLPIIHVDSQTYLILFCCYLLHPTYDSEPCGSCGMIYSCGTFPKFEGECSNKQLCHNSALCSTNYACQIIS